MKRYIALLVTMFCMLCIFSGCIESGKTTSDSVQMKNTETALAEAERQVGMPLIVNFQQRKTLKMIMELCDKENLIGYAYSYSEYTGKFTFMFKCVGYGIPAAAQFTNPLKLIEGDKYFGYDLAGIGPLEVIAQADPNGLFMPTSTTATWVIAVFPGIPDPKVVYMEPLLTVSPVKLDSSIVMNPQHYDSYK